MTEIDIRKYVRAMRSRIEEKFEGSIKNLETFVKDYKPFDNSVNEKRLKPLESYVKDFTPYDDTSLVKSMVDTNKILEEQVKIIEDIPAPFDDSELKTQISEIEPYDDSELREQVKGIKPFDNSDNEEMFKS